MMESLYDKANTRMTRLKNTGFNYEGRIFEKSMSPYLFGDTKRREILLSFETMVFFLVQKVKMIKTFYNYTVPRDYKHIN